MGEYAKLGKERIKIGTFESMYYLRYEDRHKVTPEEGNVDPTRDMNLFWRLPFLDEDNQQPGSYNGYDRGQPLFKEVENACPEKYSWPESVNYPGSIQLRHECGYLVTAPCFHGEKLPTHTGRVKFDWNGKANAWELRFIKNTTEGIFPVIGCKFCRMMWRASWEEIWEWIPKSLRVRFADYINEAKS